MLTIDHYNIQMCMVNSRTLISGKMVYEYEF